MVKDISVTFRLHEPISILSKFQVSLFVEWNRNVSESISKFVGSLYFGRIYSPPTHTHTNTHTSTQKLEHLPQFPNKRSRGGVAVLCPWARHFIYCLALVQHLKIIISPSCFSRGGGGEVRTSISKETYNKELVIFHGEIRIPLPPPPLNPPISIFFEGIVII